MILRPMTMEDADKMLEWKNYPETRKFAIASRDKIKLKDHLKWLKNNVQFFQVIDDIKGAVRIQNNEVSIWIDRAFWGQGIATEVIKLVSKLGMTAKIVEGHVGSMRAFIKAGFVPIEYIEHEFLLGVVYIADDSELNQPNYYIFKCV